VNRCVYKVMQSLEDVPDWIKPVGDLGRLMADQCLRCYGFNKECTRYDGSPPDDCEIMELNIDGI